ncbi:Pr6Pr family membrane protein [Devosia sp. A8/3-2]|nr:Pr6Pr family membrane protein [Devosia sp. A8/3-2]
MQFFLSMQLSFANGHDFPGFLGHFFAFYTILTNIVLVLIYLSEVLPTPRLELFRRPVTRGLMAANIALVGLYVYFVLRHYGALEGVDLLADNILHYLCPTLYLLWWLVSQRHGQLRWTQLPVMLAPTLVYFLYILARGVWVQQYPYPVLNVVELGYGQCCSTPCSWPPRSALLCIVVVTTDKLIARQTRTNPA